MPNILREVRELREEGKLHQRLITRTRMFLVICAILLVISVYLMVVQGGNPLLCALLAFVGFFAGYLVFSRMTPLQWNDGTEQVESASMGYLGYAMIALYILFEIAARTAIADFLGGSEAYLLSVIFGVILGRTVGVIVEIHRVYQLEHSGG